MTAFCCACVPWRIETVSHTLFTVARVLSERTTLLRYGACWGPWRYLDQKLAFVLRYPLVRLPDNCSATHLDGFSQSHSYYSENERLTMDRDREGQVPPTRSENQVACGNHMQLCKMICDLGNRSHFRKTEKMGLRFPTIANGWRRLLGNAASRARSCCKLYQYLNSKIQPIWQIIAKWWNISFSSFILR